MKRTSLSLVLALAMVAGAASTALAGSRTLRVYMYNTSSVAKSMCHVLGMKAGQPYRRTLKTFTHRKRNGRTVYKYNVPAKYDRIDIMCKANGPMATVRIEPATHPLNRYWIKVACPSSQPTAKCTASVLGGTPD